MLVPEFMRYYGYSASQTLEEFAITFFALINSMHRLKARESLQSIVETATAMSGKDGSSTIAELKKQERGLHGIIHEVRNIKP